MLLQLIDMYQHLIPSWWENGRESLLLAYAAHGRS